MHLYLDKKILSIPRLRGGIITPVTPPLATCLMYIIIVNDQYSVLWIKISCDISVIKLAYNYEFTIIDANHILIQFVGIIYYI
jgi:hypothetical protein